LLKNEYGVKEKIADIGVESCFLSEITLAELLYGIENSAPTRRFQNMERFVNLRLLFSGRVLSISNALHEYARQKATLRRIGRPVGDLDILIGATAISHQLTLVTRNVRDFQNLEGIQIANWIDS
ncbi:PIN domain-containing protein, partial [Siphonobacter sp. BAB-5385]|uniref:PIN domain-containing protein n=1 Tax=Siphonobacter sp. BAB-5385 TaxID=1864822 RepID=UPI0034E959D4